MKRPAFIIPCVIGLILFSTLPAGAFEYYLHGIGGLGSYYYRGHKREGPAAGIVGAVQASDPLSFELTFQHVPVSADSYYFLTVGARYRFLNADFFMEPSLDLNGGILYPVGEKSDVDGVLGGGLEFIYRTNHNIEFGPRIESTVVFAGPHRGLMMSWTAVVGYRFK